MTTRSPQEAREIFTKHGVSVSSWAKERGFSQSLVYQVLAGRRQAIRGESHRIALALGIKPDYRCSTDNIDEALKNL